MAGVRPISRNAAVGFGPRATSVTRRSASTNAISGKRVASRRVNWRVPTPVSRITMSNPPAKSFSAKSKAAEFSASGISRMEGATNGSPSCLRINSSISAARRLSSESTRSP
jgi:hypothetical protein